MSCGNPFGGSIFDAREGRSAALRAVPVPLDGVLPQNAEREPTGQEPEREMPERGTGTTAAVVLAPGLPGIQRGSAERLTAFLKRWIKSRLTRNHYKRGLGSMVRSRLHKMYAGQPGSIDAHHAHVKAAAWFPAGLEDTWLKYVRFAWKVFGFTWCEFLKVAGSTLSSAGDHARTAFVVLVIVIVLIVLFA